MHAMVVNIRVGVIYVGAALYQKFNKAERSIEAQKIAL